MRFRSASASFKLDRALFARATRETYGELEGLDYQAEGGIAAALSQRFHDALEAGAIRGPAGIETIVYAVEDSVIVAVREGELPRERSLPMRQLATYSIETKYVIEARDGGFNELCAGIEELLARAGALLPSLEALRVGEQAFIRGGRLWRLAVALAD